MEYHPDYLGLNVIKRQRQNDRLKKLRKKLIKPPRIHSHSWFGDQAVAERSAKLNMLKRVHLSVSSHLEELSAVQQWFQTRIFFLAEGFPWITEQFDQLNLALAEGFTNAVRHAHVNLPSSTPIEIELIVAPEKVEIRIFDQGDPFDPDSLGEPQPGVLREGGYGWFLLRKLADQVTYDCTMPETVSDPLSDPLSNSLLEGAADSLLEGTTNGLSSLSGSLPNSWLTSCLSNRPEGTPKVPVSVKSPRNCLRIVKTAKTV